MYWEIILRDGSEKKQMLGDTYKDLDKSQIEQILLREQSTVNAFPVDLNLNKVEMPNFDTNLISVYEKIPDIHMIYNMSEKCYQFDADSLDFLKKNLLKPKAFYHYFGISSKKLIIDTVPVNYKFKLTYKDKEYLLDDEEPIEQKMYYYNKAHTSIQMGYINSKQSTSIDETSVTRFSKYEIDDLQLTENVDLVFYPGTRHMYIRLTIDSNIEDIPFEFSLQPEEDGEVIIKNGKTKKEMVIMGEDLCNLGY